jgi:hypothetical protein
MPFSCTAIPWTPGGSPATLTWTHTPLPPGSVVNMARPRDLPLASLTSAAASGPREGCASTARGWAGPDVPIDKASMTIPHRTDRTRIRTAAPGSAVVESDGPLSEPPRRSSHRPSSACGRVSRRGPAETWPRMSACADRIHTGTVLPVRCRAVRSATAGAGASVGAPRPPPARPGRLEPRGAPPGAAVEEWPWMTHGATRPLPEEYETVWSSLGLFGRGGRVSLHAAGRLSGGRAADTPSPSGHSGRPGR